MHYGYILRGTVTGLFKIGISGNTKKRFSQYKTHTPERICMEAVKEFSSQEEARDWERIILSEHRDSIEHGEWLNVDFGTMAQVWALGTNHCWQELDGEFVVPAQPYDDGVPNGCLRMFRCENLKITCRLIEALDNIQLFMLARIENWPRRITDAWLDANHPLDGR